MPLTLPISAPPPTVQERLRRVVALHFDPVHGSAYWLDRSRELGVDAHRDIQTIDDLALLGDMTPADLHRRPLRDYIPRRFHHAMDRFILGQTGGTTGEGTWTAYRDDEFREAFVDPFVGAADHLGFPGGEPWLFIGPSGPHIIGKVVRHLANMMVSADPFSVDFDPRWVRKLAPGSFARHRYLQHVIDQAMAVIDNQPVGVLFTTPPVLEALAAAMSPAQRQRIRAVHYGGVAMSPEALSRFQNERFPAAIHLSGYGNTLTGCCLELNAGVPRQLDYFPHGHRLILEVVDESGEPIAPAAAARRGRVRVTRLDESMLIVRMVERDVAEPIAPPADAPEGFRLAGVRNPCPHASEAAATTVGLY